jgi:CRISPR-associated protein Cmr5
MKNIEKILPKAIDAVPKFVLNEKTNEVPKEFNGYISSFGASLISGGLLPTIVFFSQEGKAKGDRTSVIRALEFILFSYHPDLLYKEANLIETVKDMIEKGTTQNRLIDKLQDAAIALKLAIRIFPKSKKESNHE